MNKNLSPLRPAMTAIAAVIALSSTPLFAQATDSTAGQVAPVVVAPPPPAVTAPPVAAQTAAPEVSTPAPVAAPAPAPAIKTVGTPVVHDADNAAAASDTASTRAAPAPAKRVATTTSRAATVRASTPVATASVTPAKAATAPAPLPAPVAKTVPTAAETAAAAPAATPAPVAAATKTTHVSTVDEDVLPIAGGVGAAVILLGGAAVYAMRRRRRDDELVQESAPVEMAATPEAEPVVVAPKAVAPAPIAATGMARTLPNGFDISRFGRHTQAAYLGRTPDNPSYSLKRRLKRASFFDQREREAAAAGHPVAQTPIEAPVQQAARTAQDDGQITVRLAPQRKSGGFGYIFQR